MTNLETILIIAFIVIEILNYLNNRSKNKLIELIKKERDLWRDSYNILKLKKN